MLRELGLSQGSRPKLRYKLRRRSKGMHHKGDTTFFYKYLFSINIYKYIFGFIVYFYMADTYGIQPYTALKPGITPQVTIQTEKTQ